MHQTNLIEPFNWRSSLSTENCRWPRLRKNVPWKEPTKETNELKVMRSSHEHWLPVKPEWGQELLYDLCQNDPHINTSTRSENASYCIVCCSNASTEHAGVKGISINKRRKDFALIAKCAFKLPSKGWRWDKGQNSTSNPISRTFCLM